MARLFEGTDGFEDGEQRRDFVFVNDVVEANLFFAEGPPRRGIHNLGSGLSYSFNDLARIVIARLGAGSIEYIPFPTGLEPCYQSLTEADLTGLREAGFTRGMTSLAEGIEDCLRAWAPEISTPEGVGSLS